MKAWRVVVQYSVRRCGCCLAMAMLDWAEAAQGRGSGLFQDDNLLPTNGNRSCTVPIGAADLGCIRDFQRYNEGNYCWPQGGVQ
jgi:hypothetical protein